MTESTLILHSGARRAERDEVLGVQEITGTKTWFPTAHGTVLTRVERTLQYAGFGIARAQYGLSPDNNRFFATLDLESSVADGVSLAVGVRNSTDKSFPMGLTAGSRVFVCDNLSFASDIYVAKRHTRFGLSRFDEGISRSMFTLSQFQQVECRRIEHYQHCELDEQQAAACLLHGFETGILNTHLLPEAIKEWREPSHDDFQPRTAWSLFNAMTEVLKSRQSNPQKFAAMTMKVYGLIDQVAGYKVAV